MGHKTLSLILAVAAVLALTTAAFAGPPLICHPFNINGARSLPFAGPEWSRVDPSYDHSRLVADTLALLTPDTPVIVRMETMRRAAVYARDDAKLGDALMEKIQARVAALGDQNRRDPAAVAAWFDLGYLAETYKQAAVISRTAGKDFWKFEQAEPKVDGYALVKKAIAQGGGAEMEFAAAIIASSQRGQRYQDHLQKAVEGSKMDPLLAQNVASHFSEDVKAASLAH